MRMSIIIILCAFTFIGCQSKKIEITADYIRNVNWDKQANAIKINKLMLRKDSTINPFSDLRQTELLEKLEDDTSFLFVTNVKYNGESYSDRKIYFNKNNGFFWWSNKGETKIEIIGSLQNNNWYKFSDLVTYPYYIYVYVDTLGKTHSFDVNLANY